MYPNLELPFDPSLLPNYEFLAFIDRGGMGAVYRARQRSLDRPVAIKVLDCRFEADSARERFLQEARLAARLLHPNIVAVFDAGEVAGVPFIVFELVEGDTLSKRIAAEGRLSLRSALALGKGIAEGLAAAHAAGIVHRDLKPQNVLLARGDQPKIADFGIGKALGGSTVRTRENLILGTPTYMSPEQAQGQELTPATDIYSFGIMLFEMLTGAPPFSGSVTQVLQAHVAITPPPVSSLDTSIPPAVSNVLDRALEKSPAARWGSAAELASALHKASLLAASDSGRLRPSEPRPGKTRKAAAAPDATIPVEVRSDAGATVQTGKRPSSKPAPRQSEGPGPAKVAAMGAVFLALVLSGALVARQFQGRAPRTEPGPPERAVAVPSEPPSRPRTDAWDVEKMGQRATPAGRVGSAGSVRADLDRGYYNFPGEEWYDRMENFEEFPSEDAAREAGFRRYGEARAQRHERWKERLKRLRQREDRPPGPRRRLRE